jgi:hypothetical protein
MDMMDVNQDGKVSWDEYSTAMQANLEEWDDKQYGIRQHFDHADTDKSGSLDTDEMTGLIRGMDVGYLVHAVKAILKLGDTETVDGKLSLHEIIKHHDDFAVNLDIFMSDPELLFVKGVGSQLNKMNGRFVERAYRGGVNKRLYDEKDPSHKHREQMEKKAGAVINSMIDNSPLMQHLRAP